MMDRQNTHLYHPTLSNLFTTRLLLIVIGFMLTLSACSPLPGGTQGGAAPTPGPTKDTTLGPLTPTPDHRQDVTYHGGPVQITPSAFLIFWGKGWQTTDLKASISYIKSFYAHVGDTAYQNVLTQYYQVNPDGSKSYVKNVTLFADSQVWVDANDPPVASQECGAPTISDAAVHAEMLHAIDAAHWQRDDLNATYFIYTPPGMEISEPTWGCSNREFCADHEWIPEQHLSYAVMPYPATGNNGCGRGTTTTQQLAEDLVIFSAHELFESITDPTPGRADDKAFKNQGWYFVDNNQNANEIADLCYRTFSTYDLNGVKFRLQAMWSNKDGGCV